MTSTHINVNRAGLIFGAFLGLFHLVWAIMVAVGFAQAILDFIYGIHFLNNPFTVASFEVGTAALLVLVTAVTGYVLGVVLAWLCNLINKK